MFNYDVHAILCKFMKVYAVCRVDFDEIMLHQIISTEKVPLVYRVAGLGSRFVAWLIDMLVIVGLFYIGRDWQTSRGSALLCGVGRDAQGIAREVVLYIQRLKQRG